MSGAGRSTAAATLEDLGWFVIDNLPPALIGKVAELASQAGAEHERFCFVAGRGGYEGIAELAPAIRTLRSTGARVRVLFLDASDEVLVRRFEGTRRRHPVEADGVLDAIQQERALLAGAARRGRRRGRHRRAERARAARSPRRALRMRSTPTAGMETSVVSFGFKYGLPLDVDLVFDCRFLPNPHWVDELRPLTGLDQPVRDYVLAQRGDEGVARAASTTSSSFLLPAYVREGKSYLSIAIGCTGGQHRSVVLAEELAERIRQQGYEPTVHHRDIDR